MRTYDKLIAAISARRAVGGLRPSPGDNLAQVAWASCAVMQETA
jgi:hypothetical protein